MKKILIADDSNTVRKILKNAIVKNIDYIQTDEDHILQAENGLDVVALAKNHDDIDYVFVDIDMPMLNGDQAIMSLLDKNFLQQSKIVFITANSLDSKILAHKNVAGVIAKPVNIEKLQTRLKDLLFDKSDFLSEDDKISLKRAVNEQKLLVTNLIMKYVSTVDTDKKVSEDMFKKDLDECYEDNEVIPENDLIPLIEEFLVNIFRKNKIAENVEKSKIQYLMDNLKEYSEGIESTILSDIKVLKSYASNIVEASDKKTYDIEFKNELERYSKIVDKYKSKLDLTDEFAEFKTRFSDKDLEILNTFVFKIIIPFAKELDFSIENDKMKMLKNDIELCLRSSSILAEINNGVENFDFENSDYTEFMSETNKYFYVIHRFIYFNFINILVSQMRKSSSISTYFSESNLSNRITLKALLVYFNDPKKFESLGLLPEDVKRIRSKFNERNLNILYLSSKNLTGNEDVNLLKRISEHQNTNYNFYGFSQNSVLEIWIKNKQPADIVFIDDAYDDIQDKSFMKIRESYFEIFENSKIILLSSKDGNAENKELLKISSTFMKKPLNQDKVAKYLLSI
jgi:CheY-like chemotaxis protein